jgi:DnaJ-class molecular chaperone
MVHSKSLNSQLSHKNMAQQKTLASDLSDLSQFFGDPNDPFYGSGFHGVSGAGTPLSVNAQCAPEMKRDREPQVSRQYPIDVTLEELYTGTLKSIIANGKKLKITAPDDVMVYPGYEITIEGKGMPLSRDPSTKGYLIIVKSM